MSEQNFPIQIQIGQEKMVSGNTNRRVKIMSENTNRRSRKVKIKFYGELIISG